MNELEIDYKSIHRSTDKTGQGTKSELFTAFHEAVVEPENSRRKEQKHFRNTEECSYQQIYSSCNPDITLSRSAVSKYEELEGHIFLNKLGGLRPKVLLKNFDSSKGKILFILT